MALKPRMLCLGHDPVLNRTRRLILEHRLEVRLASTVPGAMALLASEPCELVLLCYSLTDEECKAMVEFVHSLQGRTRVLVMAQGSTNLLLSPNDEEFVSGGPEELLRKVSAMAGLPNPEPDADPDSPGSPEFPTAVKKKPE